MKKHDFTLNLALLLIQIECLIQPWVETSSFHTPECNEWFVSRTMLAANRRLLFFTQVSNAIQTRQ